MKFYLLVLLAFLGLGHSAHAERTEMTYELTYEVFSLPIKEAAKLKRQKSGGKEMYRILLAGIEKNTVRQEKWTTLKMVADTNISSEKHEEFIYPSEYIYDKFSPPKPVDPNSPDLFKVFLTPFPIPQPFTSFDTKKVGDSIEAELSLNDSMANLRIRAVHIRHIAFDSYGKGISEWMWPRFSAQVFTGVVQTKLGVPALAGTVSPPKELQEEKQKRIWLAFTTIEKT